MLVSVCVCDEKLSRWDTGCRPKVWVSSQQVTPASASKFEQWSVPKVQEFGLKWSRDCTCESQLFWLQAILWQSFSVVANKSCSWPRATLNDWTGQSEQKVSVLRQYSRKSNSHRTSCASEIRERHMQYIPVKRRKSATLEGRLENTNPYRWSDTKQWNALELKRLWPHLSQQLSWCFCITQMMLLMFWILKEV